MVSQDVIHRSFVRMLSALLVICMVLPLFSVVGSAASTDMPTAPLNITSVAGNGNVTLAWTEPQYSNASEVIGYNIYRGEGQNDLELIVTLGEVTHYVDVGLVNGITYCYEIKAVNSAGEGDGSEIVNATPFSTPNRPYALTVIPGNLFLKLEWSEPDFDGGSEILGYNVYREISGVWTLIATVNQTSYIDPNLDIGVTYTYRVSALNIAGEGTFSDVAEGVPDMAPGVVTDLQAFSGVRNITLTWNAPEDNGGSSILGYKIFRSSDLSQFDLVTVLMLVRTYVDLDLDDNQTYYYKVSAFNAVGDGESSYIVYSSTYDRPYVTINAIRPGDSAVTLYWVLNNNGGTDVKGYWWVYRGLSASSLSIYTIILSDELSWTDTDVENGVTYYYQIAAENDVGIGSSQIVSCTPMTTPNGPSSLTGTSRDHYVILSWNEPLDDGGSEILTYNIYKGTSEENLRYIGTTDQNSFMVGGLEIDVEYYYKVTAVNSAGEGIGSIVIIASGTTPSAPLNLTYTEGDEFVQLDWDPSEIEGSTEVDKYSIFRANSTSSFELISDSVVTNYNDTTVKNNERYTYYVLAHNSIGYSARSNKVYAYPHLNGTVPDAPLNVTAEAGEDYILVKWVEPDDGGQPIIGYEVYRGVTNETMYYFKTVSVTEANHTNVPLDMTYYYKVAAINAIGTSDFSEIVNATTVEAPVEKSEKKSIWDTIKSMIIYIVAIMVACIAVLLLLKRKMGRGRRKKRAPVQNKAVARPPLQTQNVQQKKK